MSEFQLSGRQKFLARIVQPDVFFLLLIIGVLGLVYGIYTSWRGCSGGCGRYLYRAGDVRDAIAAGEFCGTAADGAGHCAVRSGGEVHESWSLVGRWHRFDVAGRNVLIRSPLTPGGVSIGVALSVDNPVRVAHGFSDATGFEIAQVEKQHGQGRIAGRAGVVTTAVPAGGEGMIRIHGELWRPHPRRTSRREPPCGCCAWMG